MEQKEAKSAKCKPDPAWKKIRKVMFDVQKLSLQIESFSGDKKCKKYLYLGDVLLCLLDFTIR